MAIDNEKNFSRLDESSKESAKRQDAVFDRIENIVKEDPAAAKAYLRNLTKTSNLELYGRVYAKFAYITLLIVFSLAALVIGWKKLLAPTEEKPAEFADFTEMQLNFDVKPNENEEYEIVVKNPETGKWRPVGEVEELSPDVPLKLEKGDARDRWEVIKKEVLLGNVKLVTKEFYVKLSGSPYKIGTEKQFGNANDFFFRIDGSFDYQLDGDSTVRTMYQVSFAEKNDGDFKWTSKHLSLIHI